MASAAVPICAYCARDEHHLCRPDVTPCGCTNPRCHPSVVLPANHLDALAKVPWPELTKAVDVGAACVRTGEEAQAKREPVRLTVIVDADDAERLGITPGEFDGIDPEWWTDENDGHGAFNLNIVKRGS